METPVPGQFVLLHLSRQGGILLGRPFSIYGFSNHPNGAALEILYRIVGRGTRAMSLLRKGNSVKLLGPLGRGFDLPTRESRIMLVAGGVGMAALVYLSSFIPHEQLSVYLGGKTADVLVGLDRLENNASSIKIATDDGSRGFHGPVTKLLSRDFDAGCEMPERIYACGPVGMLKGLAVTIGGCPAVCQVSVEERMACGTGVCLGCAMTVKEEGHLVYKRVCKDGPVFLLSDLAWELPIQDDSLEVE
jgi:dihydroorotate dehydrogenase electron transfer subunit